MKHMLISKFSEQEIDSVDEIIDRYRSKRGSLLVVLEEIQKVCNYLPIELQRYIAREMNVSPSVVQGVVTFYSYFTTVPKGRKVIKVCTGTACYVKRSQEITTRLLQHMGIEEGEITKDGEYSVEEVRCLGACGLAPVVMVGEDTFGLVDPEKSGEILKKN
ncbi:MAG: NAD(P)H-dependent oxidoreductase subunit E [Deltaproteobacteria bacterium]|nr:NAD(P)H-dependent oxidoreductase subunit E [Deltaproteobacteria bacterium]